jgi:hypothetical protein
MVHLELFESKHGTEIPIVRTSFGVLGGSGGRVIARLLPDYQLNRSRKSYGSQQLSQSVHVIVAESRLIACGSALGDHVESVREANQILVRFECD